jgi:dTDP-4-dehydrorhamnose 3,5-epimerase|tara:strand:+ start:168 stop:662 length:495 start_codon:yes stop_codon:yes gene_type:complete
MNKGTFGTTVQVFEPSSFEDYRGELWTTWKKDDWDYPIEFNHDKVSTSRKNVVRGLHGDTKSWKLATCLYGEMYYVVVDYRQDSPTYLKWDWTILSQKNRRMVLVPPNFVNGFCVLSDHSVLTYKWSYEGSYPDVEDQFTLKWNDPKIGIDWPINNPILSKRDR